MELLRVMEMVTVVVTLGMFLTGIPPMVGMYKTGDTRNVPFLIFLLSVLSCGGMLHYGILLGISSLVFINSIGTLLQVIYTSLYLSLVKSKTTPVMYTVLAAAYMSTLYGYCYQVLDNEQQRADTIGAASSYVTTFIMLLPLTEIVGNIRNKNSDGMPLVMLLGGLACAVSWLIYGLMLNDINIYLPNIPGLAITIAKLYIVFLYGGQGGKEGKDKSE